MEGETVVGWDKIQNRGGVTDTGAQVNSLFIIWAKISFDLWTHFSKLMVAFILFSFLPLNLSFFSDLTELMIIVYFKTDAQVFG